MGSTIMVRRYGKNNFYSSSDSSYNATYTSWDMTTVFEMDPTIAVGFAKALGSKAKPTGRVRTS
jgi:hypothetical protein